MERDNWIILWRIRFDTWLAANKSDINQEQQDSERSNFANWLRYCKKSTLHDIQNAITDLQHKIKAAIESGDITYLRCRYNYLKAAYEQLEEKKQIPATVA